MKKLAIVVIILLFLGVLTVRLVQKFTAKPSKSLSEIQEDKGIPVEIEQVQPGSISQFINITGDVSSEDAVMLSSKMGGRINAIYFNIGEVVCKGDKLVLIETPDLELEKAQVWNQMKIAQNNINSALAQLENARKDKERMSRLYREQAISKKQLENYELAFRTTRQQYEAALTQMNVLQGDFLIIQTDIKDSSVYAPFSGIVGNKLADVGTVVGERQDILSFYNLEKLDGLVQIPEQYLAYVKVGQPLELTINAFPSHPLRAKISKISGAPDGASRQFNVRVDFESKPKFLRPGLFFKGRIAVQRKDNVLIVPMQALMLEGEKYTLFIVNDRNIVEKKTVAIGIESDGMAEIVSGIEKGDKVIVFGKENVIEGSKVQIKTKGSL